MVGERPYKVNNYLDHEYEPLPMMEMMHFARSTVESEMVYTNGLEDNHSKSFVTTLRYGIYPRKRVSPFLGVLSSLLGQVGWNEE